MVTNFLSFHTEFSAWEKTIELAYFELFVELTESRNDVSKSWIYVEVTDVEVTDVEVTCRNDGSCDEVIWLRNL